jgi:type I restriction enzyme S subunit
MALKKVKIGEIIDVHIEKCDIPNLTVHEVAGINKDKEFFTPTVQVGEDTSNYKIVPPGYFACNLMHVGRDFVIPIALNKTSEIVIVSPAYSVFSLIKKDLILTDYFYMIFKKIDFDRFASFCTDSSIRDGLEWNRFCDIEIDLPPIEIQQKVVGVYLAMVANQKVYEQGLDNLKLTCVAYIENLRKKSELHNLADFLEETKEINTHNEVLFERGLNKIKGFVNPSAMSNNVDLSKRKIVRHNHFVYPSPHFGEQGTIGLFKEDACIMSQMYTTFRVIDNRLNPDYLYLWFKRYEFMRYAFFAASDSVRDTFDFKKLCDYQIPIPSINIQKDIVEVYEAYEKRNRINEILKKQINVVCPVLIKGSIDLT